MNEFRESLLVLISVPIYAIVIGFEFFYSYFKNKGLYTGKGILSNIYLTSLNMGLDILVRGLCLYVLNYFLYGIDSITCFSNLFCYTR